MSLVQVSDYHNQIPVGVDLNLMNEQSHRTRPPSSSNITPRGRDVIDFKNLNLDSALFSPSLKDSDKIDYKYEFSQTDNDPPSKSIMGTADSITGGLISPICSSERNKIDSRFGETQGQVQNKRPRKMMAAKRTINLPLMSEKKSGSKTRNMVKMYKKRPASRAVSVKESLTQKHSYMYKIVKKFANDEKVREIVNDSSRCKSREPSSRRTSRSKRKSQHGLPVKYLKQFYLDQATKDKQASRLKRRQSVKRLLATKSPNGIQRLTPI